MATITKQNAQFVETDCTIEFQGKKFTSGGSFIGKRIDNNKYEGIVYAEPETNEVTSWDGKLRIPAHFGKPFINNFGCKMQSVWFTYHGIRFYGLRGCDWRQDVKVHQVNS